MRVLKSTGLLLVSSLVAVGLVSAFASRPGDPAERTVRALVADDEFQLAGRTYTKGSESDWVELGRLSVHRKGDELAAVQHGRRKVVLRPTGVTVGPAHGGKTERPALVPWHAALRALRVDTVSKDALPLDLDDSFRSWDLYHWAKAELPGQPNTDLDLWVGIAPKTGDLRYVLLAEPAGLWLVEVTSVYMDATVDRQVFEPAYSTAGNTSLIVPDRRPGAGRRDGIGLRSNTLSD